MRLSGLQRGILGVASFQFFPQRKRPKDEVEETRERALLLAERPGVTFAISPVPCF